MYNLMIADDEEIERQAFKLFIARNFPDVIVEEVANGIELVDQVMKFAPDIIVADINMPGLNGLDAIKILRNNGVASKIIILTAHDHFEYAQEALSLGADHYILKPVKRDKMMKTISACISSVDVEMKKSDDRKRLEKIVEGLDPVIEMDVMLSLLLGDLNRESFQIYLDILGVNYKEGYVITFDLSKVGKGVFEASEVKQSSLKKDVRCFLKKEMKGNYHCLVSPLSNNRVSVLVVHEEQLEPERFMVLSTQFSELIVKKIRQEFQHKITVGIGQLYHSPEELSKSYKESILSLADKSVRGEVKYYGDVFGESMERKITIESERKIVDYILQGKRSECNSALKQLFIEYEEVDDFEQIKDRVLSFVVLLHRSLEESNLMKEYKFLSMNRIYKEVFHFREMNEMEIWIQKVVDMTMKNLQLARKSKINNHVKKAIDYLNKNYMCDLSLEQVAAYIGISPYYLSRLFKQELGKTFVEYLTEIRISQAMLLLKEKKYLIKDLSEMVGYTNSTYFCKVFKKYTGKTVGEFTL